MDLQGYAILLRVRTDRGHILLLNVYLTPDPEHRARLMDLTQEWVQTHRHTEEPLLVGGDLNAAWWDTDRTSGHLTRKDTEYQSWAESLGVEPTDLRHTPQTRPRSYISAHRQDAVGIGESRIDDFLFSTEELGLPSQTFPTNTQVHSDLPHTSDHHPVSLDVDVTYS